MRSDVCSFKVASCDLGKSCEQRTLGRFCFFKVTNCDHEQRAASASFRKRKNRKRNHPFACHGMTDGFTIRGILCFLFCSSATHRVSFPSSHQYSIAPHLSRSLFQVCKQDEVPIVRILQTMGTQRCKD